MNTPLNTASADCFVLVQDELQGLGFDAFIDAIQIEPEIFSDGFEGNPLP